MRRLAVSFALVLSLLVPATASAVNEHCTIDISPTVGSPTDVYQIAVHNVPVDPDGFSIELRTDIRRLGSREGSIIFAFLVPGTTEVVIEYNRSWPGEDPLPPLAEGRYLVTVSTPHLHGACRATGSFVVEA